MSEGTQVKSAELAQWRSLVVEEILSPEQRICDAHHHLWDHPGDRYYAAEFAADINDGHNIVASVYAECGSNYRADGPLKLAPLGETEFVLAQEEALAAVLGRPLISGIVGHADMRLGRAVEEVLNAHIDIAGSRFSGIRHATAWDANPQIVNHQASPPQHLMSDPLFLEGVQTLGDMGLTYDAWIYHPQISEVLELARAAPQTTIILDHLGAPLGIGPYANRRDEVLAFCRDQLAPLAACPNVRVKLGGIGMTLYGIGWHRQAAPPTSTDIAAVWGDHIRWCIDLFGPERGIFESNFPPDRRSCSYRTLWNAFKRIAEPYTEAERDRLFIGTASETYKLNLSK